MPQQVAGLHAVANGVEREANSDNSTVNGRLPRNSRGAGATDTGASHRPMRSVLVWKCRAPPMVCGIWNTGDVDGTR